MEERFFTERGESLNACMRDCYDTCAIEADLIEGNLRIRGSRKLPITAGFLCKKGERLSKWVFSNDRLKKPLVNRSGRFVEVSWKEAIETVANRFKWHLDRGASHEILLYQYAGDRGVVNYHFPMRLFHRIGATFIDHGICDRAGQEALREVYGTSVGLSPEEVENGSLLVYWGMNPVWTNLHGYVYMRKKGVEIWTVDVRMSETARKSEDYFIIKPGSDAIFALLIAKTMVEYGWYDEDFLKENAVGFEEFREYLKRLDYSLAEEVGISRERITNFARRFWERKGVIHIGYGFQRAVRGGQAVWAVSILPALAGRKSGFIYDMKVLRKDYAEGRFLRKSSVRFVPQMKVADEILSGKVETVFVYNANPLVSSQNIGRLKRAFEKAFVVVHDIFMTDTARQADVVFPASTFFERLDIADSYYHTYVILNQPIVKLYGMSNSDLARELADALSLNDRALYEADEEVIEKVLTDSGIDPEKLWKEKVVKGRKFESPVMTPSGKIELFSSRAFSRSIYPNLEAAEDQGSYVLITPTHELTITSQYYNLLDNGYPFIHVNPSDAKEKSLKGGEKVRIIGPGGEAIFKVKLDLNLPRGVVMACKGMWKSIEGFTINEVIGDEVQEQYGDASIFHGIRVRLEKL